MRRQKGQGVNTRPLTRPTPATRATNTVFGILTGHMALSPTNGQCINKPDTSGSHIRNWPFFLEGRTATLGGKWGD